MRLKKQTHAANVRTTATLSDWFCLPLPIAVRSMKNLRILTILLLIMSWSFAGAQDVVIVKKTKSAVYAGVNSREQKISTDSSGKSDTTFSEFCKIRKAGKFYIAVTNEFSEESINYASYTSENAKTFQDFITSYVNDFGLFLSTSLTNLWKENSSYYNSRFLIDSAICSTIFFGFEGDTAVLKAVIFKNKGVTETYTVGTYANIVTDTIIVAGKIEEMRTIARNPKTWKGDFKKIIHQLIKGQIKTYPPAIVEPIHIIMVTKDGFKWLLNGCD